MSRSTNNVRKVFRGPLTLLENAVAGARKRDPNTWVFASATGVGEGALALARIAAHHGRNVIWLSDSESARAEATRMGFLAMARSSRQGWKATSSAGTIVVTHGLGDVHPGGRSGARIVQMWHGIPLKKLHLDAPAAFAVSGVPFSSLLSKAVQRVSEQSYRQIHTFAAASRASAERLQSAFGLSDEQLAIVGDARDDVLYGIHENGFEQTAQFELERALGRKLEGTTVLFAPTWRESRRDPTMPTKREFEALDRQMTAMGITLVFRPHHLATSRYEAALAGKRSLALLTQQQAADVTPLLPAFDALVSDYSSIVYDFALLARPTVFFAPDHSEYAAVPGLYESYETFSGGNLMTSWADVVAELYTVLNDGFGREQAIAHMRVMGQRMHDYHDGKSALRLWNHLEQ